MKKEGLVFLVLMFAIAILYLSQKKIIETGEWIVAKIVGIYDEIYKRWADLRDLDWRLLKAVAIVESSENANVTGDEGRSHGLMQISSLVGSSFGLMVEDLYEPNLNVQAGSGFLKEMIDKYGLEGGIQAYNLGETKFRQGLTSPTYLSKVINEYERLKGTEA